ncbi:MAG: single-stranded DNA-binding protein [Candidatus Peribacteraceae bacterium]|nr:single-stranded DNA-binding protein [Candidatus Peribacteraceae bacterium]MDD5469389.1 single-stranded DNA-binding protein [Candidatus Peribacteraceae bacterium]
MKSVNKVMLLGNVTRDPELKSTTGGQSVCTFGMATNRVWKDAVGEKQSLPEYHNLVAWGGLAEFCAQSIAKGKPLFVEGYLKTRSWDGPEGTKIFRTEIVAENIVLLGRREEGGAPGHGMPAQEEPHAEGVGGAELPADGGIE